jgi:hypothetical protein
MNEQINQPDKAWDWSRLALVAVLVLAILGIILVSSGVVDPKPTGGYLASIALTPLDLEPGESRISWLPEPSLGDLDTIRLHASLRAGSLDSAYGLAIGDRTDSIIITVSPTGYLAVERRLAADRSQPKTMQILGWQPWPHVRKHMDQNEIWVEIVDDDITTIRINRELLWNQEIPVKGSKVGLFGQSFSESAMIEFQTMEYYFGE